MWNVPPSSLGSSGPPAKGTPQIQVNPTKAFKDQSHPVLILKFSSDGLPLLCGGCVGLGQGCSFNPVCFKYDPEAEGLPFGDTWVELESMSGWKPFPASDYSASFGLAMADAGKTRSLEVTQDGIVFEVLAAYPNPEVVINGESGCLVILDEKNLFLAGGTGDDYDEDGIFGKNNSG